MRRMRTAAIVEHEARVQLAHTLLWRGGKLYARMVGASRGMDRAGATRSCRLGRRGNEQRTKTGERESYRAEVLQYRQEFSRKV